MTADSIDVAPGSPFDEVQNLPDAVLTYLLPSRYCESERFFDMASGMVAGVAPGYDQATEAGISGPAPGRKLSRSGVN